MVHPEWIIPFSFDEVKVWDTVRFLFIDNEWTKREEYRYASVARKVLDIDLENKAILYDIWIGSRLTFKPCSKRTIIDRRPTLFQKILKRCWL